MKKIRLELDHLQILRPKERWKLYFVIMAEHPTDADKMIISTYPTEPIKMKPAAENKLVFEAGVGSEGFFVLSRDMPASRQLNVHFYLRHTRQSTRNLGAILSDLQSGIGGKAMGVVTNLVGTTQPWLVIAKEAVGLVGAILEKIPDRDMGFISMFERFGPEFENQGELDREKSTSTGEAKLVYSWSVDEDTNV